MKAIDELKSRNHVTNVTVEEHHHRKSSSYFSIQTVFFIFIWYISSAVTVTTSKEILIQLQLPSFLCSVQFLLASLLAAVSVLLFDGFKDLSSEGKSSLLKVSSLYTFGFILTNSAFNIAHTGFAETIKSSEPLSTVACGVLYLNEQVSSKTVFSLIIICIGIALYCNHNTSYDFWGFILAFGSNICFSGRSVLIKKFNKDFPGTVTDVQMFAFISMIGLVLLIPLTLVLEGTSIIRIINESSSVITYDKSTIWLLMLVNGLTFGTYNLLSYVILHETDLLTHAILNAFRRVFIIICTNLYFGKELSIMNGFGLFIAASGVLIYGLLKMDKNK